MKEEQGERASDDGLDAGAPATRRDEAAHPGDQRALAVLRQLFENGFVDGLIRRLDHAWSSLDRGSIEDAVDEAILALYDALADRRTVGSPEAYVFKVAKVRAQVRHEEIVGRDDQHDFEAAEEDNDLPSGPGNADLRGEALRVARRLLPRLGQTNVQRVMGMVLDAVEADVVDITPAEIAEALGLSSGTVRQALHRGFRRLERVARDEGLQLSFADVVDDESELLHDEEDIEHDHQ